MKEKIGTIDATPKWVDLVQNMIDRFKRGTAKECQDTKDNLIKLAKCGDFVREMQKDKALRLKRLIGSQGAQGPRVSLGKIVKETENITEILEHTPGAGHIIGFGYLTDEETPDLYLELEELHIDIHQIIEERRKDR